MQRIPRCTPPTVLVILSLALALTSAFAVTPALAAWNPGGNVLASGPSNQTIPFLASDGAGGVFVFWSDDGAAAGLQLLGQHVSGDGSFLWAPGGLSVPIPFNSVDFTSPITDQQGGSIIFSWSNLSTGHAQRLNAAGAQQWGSTGVDLYTTPSLTTGINITFIPAGGTSPTTDPIGVIATWDEKVSPTGSLDIYAQRLDASGAPMWGTLASPAVVCGANGDQNSEVICTDGPSGPSSTHGAYVAWYDQRPGFPSIYINRISNAGVPAWPDGIQLLSLNTLSSGPYMDYFGSNSALVVWTDTRRTGNADIYAQKVRSDGTVAWTPDGIEIVQAPGSRTGIFMTPSNSGGEFLAWDDSRSDVSDVYAQKIDANGSRQWGVGGIAVGVAANRQLVDTIVPDGSGGVFIFWFDRRSGTNSDLWGQHLDSNGIALWTPGGLLLVPLHITPGILSMSSMPDGAGGFILAWHDRVSVGGNYDSFISRFNSSGNTVVLAAEPATPGAFGLALASSNPARNGARFSVQMPADGVLSAEVLDLEGRVVRELASSAPLSAGPHTLAWDGRNESGERALPGVYFAVARVGTMSRMLKLVELR